MRLRHALPLIGTGLLVLAGCTSNNSAAPASGRTVELTMVDNAFQSERLEAKKGETVIFRFKNTGNARHEALIGDNAAQDKHHAEMNGTPKSGDDKGHESPGHNDPSKGAVVVEPGKSGDLTYTFKEAGTFLIGCHEPNHYEEGMKATITVK